MYNKDFYQYYKGTVDQHCFSDITFLRDKHNTPVILNTMVVMLSYIDMDNNYKPTLTPNGQFNYPIYPIFKI